MYNSNIRTLAVLLLSFSGVATMDAQVLKRDTIEPKKQVEVIRFGDDDDNDGRKRSSPTGQNIIKTAPLSFILGYFPVFYEREVTDWLGIQAGAGLTFKPAISSIQSEFYNEFGDCEGEDCGNYFDYSYRKGKIGYLLALSPRLYFSSDGLDGSYIAPEIRLYQRKSEAQRPDPSNPYELVRLEDEFDEESIRFTDLMMHFGWQTLYPNLTLDLSVGLGVRKIKGTWQAVYQDDFGYYYSETPERDESRFRFDVGLRVGFQL